jgi:hypothetical protein
MILPLFLTTIFIEPKSIRFFVGITILTFICFYFHDMKQKIDNCMDEIRFCEWDKNLINIFTTIPTYYNLEAECLICLENFLQSKDRPRKIKCDCTKNVYHESCLTQWFEKNCSCPVCRKSLNEKIHYL